MPTSVRLDPETESLLKRLARQSRRSKSAVIRDALHRLAEDSAKVAESPGPYSLVADLIGIADGGPSDLARRHKQAYREAVAGKHRR